MERKNEDSVGSMHEMIRDNAGEISRLKSDVENLTALNNEMNRTYLFLVSFIQEQRNGCLEVKQEDMSSAFIESLISKHNEILAEQISFLERAPKPQSKYSEKYNEQSTRYMENKIKSKIKFYQRECSQIQEFVMKEIEFELEEDNSKIKELNNMIFTLSNDLNQTKLKLAQLKTQKLEFELSDAFNRMVDAKQRIDDRFMKLSNLKAENEQIQATIDSQIEISKRLEKEKNDLYEMKKMLEKISF